MEDRNNMDKCPIHKTDLFGHICPICVNNNKKDNDPVNHPSHYTSHPRGVECITITRHMSFNLGNALKYIWRADLKGNALEDLQKAEFYIRDEIEKRKTNG